MRSWLAEMSGHWVRGHPWVLRQDFVCQVASRACRAILPTKPLRPYDVFVFPVIDWDFRFQRPQHLSLEFARRDHRVFYFSTRCLSTLGGRDPRPELVASNTYRCALPGAENPPDIYRDIPNELQLACLEFGLRCLKEKFAIGATLSIVDYPFWLPLMRRLNDNVVLYDCM